jgi:hypothetical protein
LRKEREIMIEKEYLARVAQDPEVYADYMRQQNLIKEAIEDERLARTDPFAKRRSSNGMGEKRTSQMHGLVSSTKSGGVNTLQN